MDSQKEQNEIIYLIYNYGEYGPEDTIFVTSKDDIVGAVKKFGCLATTHAKENNWTKDSVRELEEHLMADEKSAEDIAGQELVVGETYELSRGWGAITILPLKANEFRPGSR